MAADVRNLEPHWNAGLVTASIAISFLGTFTSTQLVCQARLSRHFHAVVVWTFLASLTFGFCSIWCLHFVATLAYELDLPVGLNIPLTVLSAILAVSFTFIALISDFVWELQSRKRRKPQRTQSRKSRLGEYLKSLTSKDDGNDAAEPLFSRISEDHPTESGGDIRRESQDQNSVLRPSEDQVSRPSEDHHVLSRPSPSPMTRNSESPAPMRPQRQLSSTQIDAAPTFLRTLSEQDAVIHHIEDGTETSSEYSYRRYSDTNSDTTSFGLGLMNSTRVPRSNGSFGNPILMMAHSLWSGFTIRNIVKGFFWSLAITSMHYAGIMAMKIPQGWCTLEPGLVLLSALISWAVCTIGCIVMAQMESFLLLQILFSVVATAGVAAMHFTGMAAARFWSYADAQETRGYPSGLSVSVVSIALLTCLSANGLLVHSATIARNKLTEVIRTRRKLWAALAQKEHAEASAQARSEFIASASHEIRTPLHQLQGYGDLLAREKLTEEGRMLLCAIQDATKTLSLITNNVLDWSRLEKGEAANRPTFLDIRDVIDSVIGLLPNRNEDNQVEILVSISPDVPASLFMDELSLTRIILNLLSNACKFTTHGYVLLTVHTENDSLVINVEDTGCGVPETFLPQLFEPFKQAQTRGAERGTGLGLSIVKQLLAKMRGVIEVQSKYREDVGVVPEEQGSKFTVTIPLLEGPSGTDDHAKADPGSTIAVFEHQNARLPDGLKQAWKMFGIDTKSICLQELSSAFKYVWASASVLSQMPELLQHLTIYPKWLVFVPYDNENSLYEVLGARPPSHFVPVRRPLAWHRIMKSIDNIRDMPLKDEVGRPSVRFASDVEIMNGAPAEPLSKPSEKASPVASEAFTIMLVEDNKINQKLGMKMLKMCGYNVLIANDGQEAIDLLLEQDESIDLILMDQSMPRKDGLQATKEIREMEEQKKLKGSLRLRGTDRGPRRIIIAVTAVVGPAHEALCKTVGTDAFLPKPLSLKRLKEFLNIYLII